MIKYFVQKVKINFYLLFILYLSDSIMFRESVIVKDGEHQGLVKSIRIRKILELKGFVEKWIHWEKYLRTTQIPYGR